MALSGIMINKHKYPTIIFEYLIIHKKFVEVQILICYMMKKDYFILLELVSVFAYKNIYSAGKIIRKLNLKYCTNPSYYSFIYLNVFVLCISHYYSLQ